MKRVREIVVVLVVLVVSGAGVTWIESSACGRSGAASKRTSKPTEDRDGGRPLSKGLEKARDPRAAIRELEAKYEGVAIGKFLAGTQEYRTFSGDCFLLGALDLEEADDLLADWFVKADEEEESPPNERKGRSLPSIRAIIAINRPRWAVIERMLVSAPEESPHQTENT